MEDLLTINEAAAYLGVTRNALAQWRFLGKGPKYLAPTARTIRYRKSWIDEWLAASERTQTGQAAA